MSASLICLVFYFFNQPASRKKKTKTKTYINICSSSEWIFRKMSSPSEHRGLMPEGQKAQLHCPHDLKAHCPASQGQPVDRLAQNSVIGALQLRSPHHKNQEQPETHVVQYIYIYLHKKNIYSYTFYYTYYGEQWRATNKQHTLRICTHQALLAAPCSPEAHSIFHCMNQHRAAARQHLPDCCQVHPRHLGHTYTPTSRGRWVGEFQSTTAFIFHPTQALMLLTQA